MLLLTTSHGTKRPCQGGFTLIEVLISVALAVTLAVVGIVNLIGLRSSNKIVLAGDEVVSLLRTTQTRALSQEGGKSWGVYFDNTTSSEASISVFTGTTFSAGNAVSKKLLDVDLQFTEPEAGATLAVVFNELGGLLVSASAQSVTLALKKNVSVSTTITVFPNGRVEKTQ